MQNELHKIQINNLALVLSGGAARGAFHLGVLSFFEQHNIEIKAYSGSSIGAIISASHASGISAKEQLRIFSSKDIRQKKKIIVSKKISWTTNGSGMHVPIKKKKLK